ncbi:hypothetical protein HJG60_008893 [Phyllostomus discolor]|uniref:Uncharacterized protein n=1 Tax=Phyllostomus discolor TaxID=89673 RepID=A0A833YUB0_9CHIR|nr:hypothetical protein HJG60_008893 [Phyllostomus discolor]
MTAWGSLPEEKARVSGSGDKLAAGRRVKLKLTAALRRRKRSRKPEGEGWGHRALSGRVAPQQPIRGLRGWMERDLHRPGSPLCLTPNRTEGTLWQGQPGPKRGHKGAELSLTPFSSQTQGSEILLLLAEPSGWIGTEKGSPRGETITHSSHSAFGAPRGLQIPLPGP